MIVRNITVLLRMIFDIRSYRLLKRIHSMYKNDPLYSLKKIIVSSLNTVKNDKINYFNNDYIVTSFLPPLFSNAFISVLEAVRESENKFTQQAHAKRCGPISFFLSITDRCNYNCIHCSAKNRAGNNELTTDEWLQTIKNIQDIKTAIIGFTGGEALMRDDLTRMIRSVHDDSITILYTNGRLLSYEKAVELKSAGLYAVGVSFDSFNENEHNAIRNNQSGFSDAVCALQNASRAGLYTIAQLVLLRNRIDKKFVYEYMKFVKKLGVHEVRILEPIKAGHLLNENDDFFLTKDDRKRLINIQKYINNIPGMPKLTTFAHTESFEQFGCGAGTQHSYITSEGELLPCDFVPLSFGNVKRKPLSRLWREMNDTMGNPKDGCFAFTIQNDLQKNKSLQFPLPEEISKEICAAHKKEEFPKFYRILR
ncbi:MAG: hypothetical protein A2015_11510 [Spirochaetes bacterium GWF1_31_7]|nr:MAG: hypothetical protein A2Y30_15565 [Spirochaetes bacterium GWE1_32_154]OHD49050.1 MAG: hypothetical protein A2015_11510 [Spirochaetes bacterium GWF1_31_7]OHD50366.1 MAG: hypothetical protein A2Y29_13615 [Spirochaetes bacterium GWE2_31_10]OHD75738.1 MAG: hypothetical protein A2355_00515 [Spirochaetes bacterium RIFOXYB1_FULL_32_8]HBD93845.1 radical SAM protein [Spirochaetia bacterium]